jgi:hypothetical protein
MVADLEFRLELERISGQHWALTFIFRKLILLQSDIEHTLIFFTTTPTSTELRSLIPTYVPVYTD